MIGTEGYIAFLKVDDFFDSTSDLLKPLHVFECDCAVYGIEFLLDDE